MFFFFKQKTAYEMRISDWSSDVCSSDLRSPESKPSIKPRHKHVRALPLKCAPPRKRINASLRSNRQKPQPMYAPKKSNRSEEGRVGNECVSTGRCRGSPVH